MAEKKRVGVILSGSGYLDGAEIQEAVLTLYFLDQVGVTTQCFSVNQDQHHSINHHTQTDQSDTRNVLEESARIARGAITDIQDADPKQLDALIMPGGFGVAKNLSNVAFKGSDCTINTSLATVITALHHQQKPLGFMCISPVIAAKLIPNVTVTIGHDQATADTITQMGGNHVVCHVNDIIIDEANKVISTPAYMDGDATISQIGTGIEKLVTSVLSRIKVSIPH